MAVIRQVNWKGQWRVDVPHLRMIESAVAGDFDALAGAVLTGKLPYIVSGFIPAYTLGADATSMQLATAGSVVMNYAASESGTILMVPSDRPVETLDASNGRVNGGFTANSTNYVAIDFLRSADPDTADIVQFIDATTVTETPKTIPLARTLDYRIFISTTPFSNTTNLAPICVVVTDANSKIVSVKDARTMYFRLGLGGDIPDALGTYTWPQGRGIGVTPTAEVESFTGGDKAITNEKDWKSAVMTSIWEIKGGEYWYSSTTDRNLQFTRGPLVTLADNFVWDGTDLLWEALSIVMTGSTAVINDIENQLAPSPGLTDLLDGECIYVDVDRTTDHVRGVNGLVPVKSLSIQDIGTPFYPGSRYILAWRVGADVYVRGQAWEVGREIVPTATELLTGIVRLSSAAPNPAIPKVAPTDAGGRVLAVGITREAAGTLAIGTQANDTAVTVGRSGIITSIAGPLAGNQGITGSGLAPNGAGVSGTGIGSGAGVEGTGGANGHGVKGTGNATFGGVFGQGGAASGPGVWGTGGLPDGYGVLGQGVGAGAGVRAIGSTTGSGVLATGGATSGTGVEATGGAPNGIGVEALGTGTGQGVYGEGGTTSAIGVQGRGGAPNGVGVRGDGTGSGVGVLGQGGVDGVGGAFYSGSNNSRGALYLNPQLAPSNPQPGDFWLESTAGNVFWRVIGETRQVASKAYVDTSTLWALIAAGDPASVTRQSGGFSVNRQAAGLFRVSHASFTVNTLVMLTPVISVVNVNQMGAGAGYVDVGVNTLGGAPFDGANFSLYAFIGAL